MEKKIMEWLKENWEGSEGLAEVDNGAILALIDLFSDSALVNLSTMVFENVMRWNVQKGSVSREVPDDKISDAECIGYRYFVLPSGRLLARGWSNLEDESVDSECLDVANSEDTLLLLCDQEIADMENETE